jgi:hypothetical protein
MTNDTRQPAPNEESQARDQMTHVMRALEELFPDCYIGLLLQKRTENPQNMVNYIGNGSRAQVRRMMMELVQRWGEGEHTTAPRPEIS